MVIQTDVQLLKLRRTKIVATLGPASVDDATIAALIAQGVDMFRLNMSHGDQAGHAAAYHKVRDASSEAGRPIAILADLCGPKIRVGHFRGGSIELIDGETVVITTRDVEGEPGLIPSQYAALADDLKVGARVLLAGRRDGAEGHRNRCNGSDLYCHSGWTTKRP